MATAGYTTIGANDQPLATTNFSNPTGLQFTMPSDGTVTLVSAAIKAASGTHNYTAQIYSDVAGLRGVSLFTSNVSANATSTYAFKDATFSSPPNLTSGTTYWLQIAEATGNPGVTNLAFDTGGGANSSYSLSDLGVPQYGTSLYSQYITYTPSGSSSGFNIALV